MTLVQYEVSWVYHKLLADSSLYQRDTLLQNWLLAANGSNCADICEIRKKYGSGQKAIALQQNTAFSPQNNWEENYKTVQQYWLAGMDSAKIPLTARDSQNIRYIAYQCPDIGGKAVYEARALLHLLGEPVWQVPGCTPSLKHSPTNDTTSLVSPQIKIWPNPAKEVLHVSIHTSKNKNGTFRLYNAMGILLTERTLQPGENYFQLNTTAYPAGILLYHINGIGQQPIQGKIVLVK